MRTVIKLNLNVFIALSFLTAGICVFSSPVIAEPAAVKINEIMFDPVGVDTGNEWVELYNKGDSSVNLSGWTISNRTGQIVATLADWDLPIDCYLVVYFGIGTNDNDFSDGSGALYTRVDVEDFNNIEEECALYDGIPSSTSIVDFVSWCSDADYNPGSAHDYAVGAGIWDSGDYFDTGFPTGKTIWDGNPVGRDKSSTDTDQPDDWDSKGGVDAYYPTPGAKNTGPLYSVHDGIKLTQLKVNLLLNHLGYRFTYSNHTILEEYQTDDEIYVKANHNFEVNLNGIVEYTFTGEGEYHWYKINASAWKEEINFLLSTSDLTESFSAAYTKESVTSGLKNTIDENLSLIHSYEVFDTNEPLPDEQFIPNPPVRVEQDNYTSDAYTTITQTDSNRYSTEVIQDVNDRGLIWNLSFVKDELTSYGKTEAWTTLNLTNNIEGAHSISTHYNMVLGEGLLAGRLGDLNVSYDDYSVVFGSKTFMLDGPGYIRMEKVSDSRLDVVSNIQIANVNDVSETLDLGSSGNVELLNIDGEEIIKGYFTGNTVPKINQFYIDGAAGAGIGAAACAATGYLAASLVIGAPAEATNPVGWATWITRGLVTVGSAAVCAIAGNAVEPDKTPPTFDFKDGDSGSNKVRGWKKVTVTVTDADSDLSKIQVGVQSTTTGKNLCNKKYENKDSPWKKTFTLRNKMCVRSTQVITVTATDDSAAKNQASAQHTVIVPARDCTPNVKETDPKDKQCYAPVDKNIRVTFCKSMDQNSAENAISVSPPIDYTISWSEGDTIIVLDPIHNLTYNTTYTVNISTDAMSTLGYYLKEPYNFSFSTDVVDDFESYNLYDNLIHDTWLDGRVNGTTAGVFLAEATAGAPVHSGEQAMAVMYNNMVFPHYAEVSRTFDEPQDWTAGGIRALSLWFYGHPVNAPAQMYVALEDLGGNRAMLLHANPNATTLQEWQEWNIDLQEFTDVNLANMAEIAIGIGDPCLPEPGWLGTLHVDDIRLYPPRCFPEYGPVADFTGDCVVDYEDLDTMTDQWLSDYFAAADLNSDGIVNLRDYSIFAEMWLNELLWPHEVEPKPWFQEWGCDTQCHGDADCAKQGLFQVSLNDFNILLAAMGTHYPHPLYAPGADFNRDLKVNQGDYDILQEWFNRIPGPPADCPITP